MAMYFSNEDVQLLLSEVSLFDVVNYLGLPTKKQGHSLSILCPNPKHPDHHFGSCLINEYKGYCFACSTPINPINILMWSLGVSYYQAIVTLANLSRHPERFEGGRFKNDNSTQLMLSNKEKELIGLSVYQKDKCFYGLSSNKPNSSSFIRDENGDYLLYSKLSYNPWLSLSNDDRAQLIQGKCLEKLSQIIQVQTRLNTLNSSSLYIQELLSNLKTMSKEVYEVYIRVGGKCKTKQEFYDAFNNLIA